MKCHHVSGLLSLCYGSVLWCALSIFSLELFKKFVQHAFIIQSMLSFNTCTSVMYCKCTFWVHSMAELVDVFKVGHTGVILYVSVLEQELLPHSQVWTRETWLTWQRIMLRDILLITGCLVFLQIHQKNTGYGQHHLTLKLCMFLWRCRVKVRRRKVGQEVLS